MIKRSYQLACITFVLIASLINSALAASILGLNNPDRIPGSYIVVLKDNVAQTQSVASLASSVAASVGGEVSHTYTAVLNGFAIRLSDVRVAELANHASIKYIEADGMAYAIAVASWGIDRVDQRNLPLNNDYSPSQTGSGVNAYIIDTGINANHSDFGNRVTLAHDAVGDGNGPSDCHGHGTHVAGTVGGATFGVARSVKLHAVRGLDCNGEAPWSVVIAAMDWVRANHTKPAVANMSIGGGSNTAVNDAANNLVNAGVFVATASGNENQNSCNSSPGSASGVFNVGATSSDDARSSFSNWGSCVDIMAPGSNIRSASHSSNNGTVTMSGTSMASPHVAGAGALVLSVNPNYTPSQVKSALTSSATGNVLSGLNGSPNRLLYVGGGSSSGGSSSGGSSGGSSSGGSSSGGNQLQNGVPVSGLSASTGNQVLYSINVPSGATNLVIKISGGSGDADLYTRAGVAPTDSTYACRPYASGNSETCTEPSPTSGVWYARVKAYESFSNVTLTASYSGGGSSSGGSSSGGSSSGGSSSGGSSSGGSSSGGNQLQNGVPVNGLTATTGNQVLYTINVPSGASNLVIKISGGSGDADLYTRAGVAPTDSSYACRPYASGNSETCTEPSPIAGTWYARVKAYSSFSNVTITASYSGGGSSSGGSSSGGSSSGGSSSGGGNELQNNVAKTISGAQNQNSFYTMNVPSGASNLSFTISGGSGDADLYVRFGQQPTTSTYDCRPYAGGNNETCNVPNVQTGTYHIMIRGYEAYSNVSLKGSYNN